MPRLTPALCLLTLAACDRLSDADAERLVRDYNAKVIEAYRTADPQLAAPLVGDAEFKKLTGLIGARQDADLVLDSELLSLDVRAVERARDEVTVTTHERWYYRDRRIGSGAQVGDDSTDEYEMRYVLVRDHGRWLVDRIEWAAPPKVGRKTAPLTADAEHSRLRPTPAAEPAADGGAAQSDAPDGGTPP